MHVIGYHYITIYDTVLLGPKTRQGMGFQRVEEEVVVMIRVLTSTDYKY